MSNTYSLCPTAHIQLLNNSESGVWDLVSGSRDGMIEWLFLEVISQKSFLSIQCLMHCDRKIGTARFEMFLRRTTWKTDLRHVCRTQDRQSATAVEALPIVLPSLFRDQVMTARCSMHRDPLGIIGCGTATSTWLAPCPGSIERPSSPGADTSSCNAWRSGIRCISLALATQLLPGLLHNLQRLYSRTSTTGTIFYPRSVSAHLNSPPRPGETFLRRRSFRFARFDCIPRCCRHYMSPINTGFFSPS